MVVLDERVGNSGVAKTVSAIGLDEEAPIIGVHFRLEEHNATERGLHDSQSARIITGMSPALKLVSLRAEATARSLRVVIAASDRFARVGLTTLLDRFDDLHVVGDVEIDDRTVSRVRVMNPDVLLVDAGSAPPRFLAGADVPVVMLIASPRNSAEAFDAGAGAVLLRTAAADKLHAALRAVANDLVAADPDIAAAIFDQRRRAASELEEPLTHRELEVMQHLANGHTNREIANLLGITEHTVKFHVNSILAKLGADSRTEAVVRAARLGIVVI
jgi:two-component system, NarL family, nitrate/nitrite response regulator NarL